jgi:hypothetical protein
LEGTTGEGMSCGGKARVLSSVLRLVEIIHAKGRTNPTPTSIRPR